MRYSTRRPVFHAMRGLSWCHGTALRWFPLAFLRYRLGVSRPKLFVYASPAGSLATWLSGRKRWIFRHPCSDLDANFSTGWNLHLSWWSEPTLAIWSENPSQQNAPPAIMHGYITYCALFCRRSESRWMMCHPLLSHRISIKLLTRFSRLLHAVARFSCTAWLVSADLLRCV